MTVGIVDACNDVALLKCVPACIELVSHLRGDFLDEKPTAENQTEVFLLARLVEDDFDLLRSVCQANQTRRAEAVLVLVIAHGTGPSLLVVSLKRWNSSLHDQSNRVSTVTEHLHGCGVLNVLQ